MEHLTDEYKGYHLCEILDCVHNEDNICKIDAWPFNELCEKKRSIKNAVFNKPIEMQFDKDDCLELSLRSHSKGAQKKRLSNEDRHLFNFGVFYDGNKFEKPPLFDFGLGLFEHDACYVNKSLHECRKLMSQKPFHNWEEALDYFADKYTFPKSKQLTVRKDFLPSALAYEYLQYSVKRLGLEVELCD